LREFHFTYGRIHMYGKNFTIMDLQRTLLEHAKTLEVLQINYDDDWDKVLWDEVDPNELRFNKQLSQFMKLKKLTINSAALLGVSVPLQEWFGVTPPEREPPKVSLPEMLPQSLEHLEIICCDHRVMPHLQELASAYRTGRFKDLKVIKCIFAEEHTDQAKIRQIEIPDVQVGFTFCDLARRGQLIWTEPGGDRGKDHSELFDDEMLLYYK